MGNTARTASVDVLRDVGGNPAPPCLGAAELPRVPAMAIGNAAQRLLALRVVLLRIRLLAIRGLLRWVIALRSFIRRHRHRMEAGIQPARFRVDPWVSAPIGQRKGRLLPVLLVGAGCVVTGFMMGRQYEGSNGAPSPAAEAVAENSAVKPLNTGAEADLALQGENANASIEGTQTEPTTPNVIVPNPGTADQDENSRTPASAQVRTPPSSPQKRPGRTDRPRPPAKQSYLDLRDYVLRQQP